MKCSYKARWFSSKGACLVLLWTLLIFTVSFSLARFVADAVHIPGRLSANLEWMILGPVLLVALFCAPLSGWLADAKFGHYKVFRVGAVLLFISTLLNCLLLVSEILTWDSHVLKWIHLCLASTLFVVGGCTCFATALPLGLDQMPDASSSSITSYIAWFVCSIFVGYLINEVLNLLRFCFSGTLHMLL